MKKTIAVLAILILGVAACQRSGNQKNTDNKVIIQPNKVGELAQLMKDLRFYSSALNKAIKAGDSLRYPFVKTFEKIVTAEATDPEINKELLNSYATAFIASMKKAVICDTNQRQNFNTMVDVCVSCHIQLCPGPLKSIKKLYLKSQN